MNPFDPSMPWAHPGAELNPSALPGQPGGLGDPQGGKPWGLANGGIWNTQEAYLDNAYQVRQDQVGPQDLPVPSASAGTVFLVNGGVIGTADLLDIQQSSGISVIGGLASGGVRVTIAATGVTGGITSVFGRTTPAIVATAGDYNASQITNAVSTTGSYANPAWITSLDWSKIINAPPPGSGGAVDSVFGRQGTVVATTGDYNASQITNAVSTIGSYANPAWITSLDWSKIINAPPPGSGAGPDFTTRVTINTTGGGMPADANASNAMLHIASAGITTLVLEGQDPGANMGVIRTRSTGGPFTSPGAINTARSLGAWYMDGHDGSGYISGAMIQAVATQGWSALQRGTRLTFWSCRTGQQIGTTGLSIAGDGGVVCGAGASGFGPGTLNAPNGVYVDTGNLSVNTGTIMVGGEDLLQIIFLAAHAAEAAHTAEAALERRVTELERRTR